MPRRSDAELLQEHQEKQLALTRRMARKADPTVKNLENASGVINWLQNLGEGFEFTEEEREIMEMLRVAVDRVASERVGAWAEKNNATPRMF
jgi:hypothetical protein